MKDTVLRRAPLLLLMAAHLPLVIRYFTDLWRQQAHYQFFPFAIGAFVVLAIQRRRDVPEKWSKLTIGLVLLDLLCVVGGIIIFSPWLFAAGLFFLILAWCVASEEKGYGRRLTYLALLPLLTIRLPMLGDEQVIRAMQSVTTKVASMSLQRFGFLHVRSGNILDFPGKRFLVAEACSGVQSLFTILFIAALVICVQRRGMVHGLVLMASGLMFAGLMNVARVMSIAVAWENYALDLSTGWQHDVLGYACLTVAALLLMSADSFLAFITDPVPDVRRPGPVAPFRNPLVAVWNRLLTVRPRPEVAMSADSKVAPPARSLLFRSLLLCLSTGVCAVLLTIQCQALMRTDSLPGSLGRSTLQLLNEDSLPVEISGFVRDDYGTETRATGSEFGEFSNYWTYVGNGLPVRVACDHPFFGWHPLEQCYINQGWQLNELSTEEDANGWQAVVVRLSHPTKARHGLMIYSLFDRGGRPLQPLGLGSPGEMLMERLFRTTGTGLLEPMAYQSQVFSESTLPLDAAVQKQLVQLHFSSRAEMKQQITAPQP